MDNSTTERPRNALKCNGCHETHRDFSYAADRLQLTCNVCQRTRGIPARRMTAKRLKELCRAAIIANVWERYG